jgi:hypothetical protein
VSGLGPSGAGSAGSDGQIPYSLVAPLGSGAGHWILLEILGFKIGPDASLYAGGGADVNDTSSSLRVALSIFRINRSIFFIVDRIGSTTLAQETSTIAAGIVWAKLLATSLNANNFSITSSLDSGDKPSGD